MSRPTSTLLGSKALEAILKGVNAIYEPVKRTFGPSGSNALLFRVWNRGSRITNDGVTVSECQTPKDIHVRLVAESFKEASKKTNEKVGDGTTLTTLLGGHLFNTIYKKITEKSSLFGADVSDNVMEIKKSILESSEKVKEAIKKSAKQVKTLAELEKISTISVEDAELGKVIAKMAWEVGVDGFIDVVEGYKGEIETEIIKGMRFPAKIPGKGFINNVARFEMVANNCPVLVTNYDLDNVVQLANVINPLLKKNPKLILIAPSFSAEVLADLFKACYNLTADGQRVKGTFDIFPVSVPSLRTEQFEDLAIYCGAKFIDKAKGSKLQNAGEGSLGFLEKLVVKSSENKEDAIAVGGAGVTGEKNESKEVGFEIKEKADKTPIQVRIEELKGQLKETPQESFKKLLERRIASMGSAVGVIRVGDSTEASSLYRKLKIEDAVYACKAALRGGYVKGGGLCLKEIADRLLDTDILKETLKAPYEQIKSSGITEIGADVIDPAEAIYYGIEHSTQVVANLITVESITAEIEDPSPEEGNFAIANWLKHLVITQKIKEGQLKANEAEAWSDSMGGLTEDEYEKDNENK